MESTNQSSSRPQRSWLSSVASPGIFSRFRNLFSGSISQGDSSGVDTPSKLVRFSEVRVNEPRTETLDWQKVERNRNEPKRQIETLLKAAELLDENDYNKIFNEMESGNITKANKKYATTPHPKKRKVATTHPVIEGSLINITENDEEVDLTKYFGRLAKRQRRTLTAGRTNISSFSARKERPRNSLGFIPHSSTPVPSSNRKVAQSILKTIGKMTSPLENLPKAKTPSWMQPETEETRSSLPRSFAIPSKALIFNKSYQSPASKALDFSLDWKKPDVFANIDNTEEAFESGKRKKIAYEAKSVDAAPAHPKKQKNETLLKLPNLSKQQREISLNDVCVPKYSFPPPKGNLHHAQDSARALNSLSPERTDNYKFDIIQKPKKKTAKIVTLPIEANVVQTKTNTSIPAQPQSVNTFSLVPEKNTAVSTNDAKPVSNLFAKFMQKNEFWKCDVCLTNQNPLSATKCQACENPRPGSHSEAKETAGSDANLTTTIFAAKDTTGDSNATSLNPFASSNETSASEAPKPLFGSMPKEAPVLFGAKNSKEASAPISNPFGSLTGTSSTPSETVLGKPASKETTNVESSSGTSTNLFGSTTTSTDSKPAFSFGATPNVEKENDKKTEVKTSEPATKASTGFSFGASNGDEKATTSLSTTNPFGAASSTTSLFGSNETTAAASTAKPNLFGSASESSKAEKAPLFGSSQNETKASSTLFGQTATSQTSSTEGNIFKTDASATPVATFSFGSSGNNNNGTTFGTSGVGSKAPVPSDETSILGKKRSNDDAKPETSNSFSFGNTGNSSTEIKNPFGSSTAATAAANPFTTSASSSSNIFGQASKTNSTNGTNPFGSNPSSATASNPFGSAPAQTASTSMFGSTPSTTASPQNGFSFGQNSGSNGLSATTTSNPFGTSTGGFGSASNLTNNNNNNSSFGTSSAGFGGASATGNSNMFGGATSNAGPFGQSSSNMNTANPFAGAGGAAPNSFSIGTSAPQQRQKRTIRRVKRSR